MKRHLLGTAGAFTALILAAGCAEDPTDSLRSGVVRVQASKSYIELSVGDVTELTAQAFDEQGNAIVPLPTVTSTNPSIATVEVDQTISGDPIPETNFTLTAVGYGSTTLTVESSGLSGSVAVVTFPQSLGFVTPPATLGSGGTVTLTTVFFDTDGNAITPLTEVAPLTWSSSNASVATVDATGLVTGKGTGDVTITITLANGVTAATTIEVVPGVFEGTLSAASLGFADTLVIKPSAAVAWDGDEVVMIGGVTPSWIVEQTTDSIVVLVPNLSAVGAAEVLVLNQGPDQLAQSATLDVTSVYTVNGTPDAGLDITAGPFPLEFFVELNADEVDDFYTFNPAGDLDITVTLVWPDANDIDLLWCDAGCASFVGNFSGATGSNPEVSSVTVPAGTTWNLWLNYYSGSGASMIRVTITSP